MNTFCQRHSYSGPGDCPYCKSIVCENCDERPSTENWGGKHDSTSLARNHRLVQRWCHRCVIVAQIAHMRLIVPKLPALEAELAALDQIGSVSDSSEAKLVDDRAGAERETTDVQPTTRLHWELSPVNAERLQQEFDQRIEVNPGSPSVTKRHASNTLRDILAELTPRPKEGSQ